MEALLYFAAWAFFIFVMMRLGCGRHVMGHGSAVKRDIKPSDTSNSIAKWIAPERDTDPVCGKSVLTGNAKPSVYDGSVYYFCSRECREVFEADPTAYIGAPMPKEPVKKLEQQNA